MYYLHHYFDPDFSHLNLSPREAADGSIDYRYLGYVQNVVAGQVLAECLDLEKTPEFKHDYRFMYKEPRLPLGPNTALHESDPNKIIATTNGYVFYSNGLISVKKLLNIRGNIGFHTGNIFFVGDVAVHGDIQTGFAVQAANILVKKHIESAKVKASDDIVCLGGVKGADFADDPVQPVEHQAFPPAQAEADLPRAEKEPPLPNTLLDAGGSIRLPFCERVQLRARGNVIIDGSCLHSTIYVGGNLIIRGKLLGGTVYANGMVYVEKQIGSQHSSQTRIMMGYNPFHYLSLQKLESQMRYLFAKASYFARQAARNRVMKQEFEPRLEIVQSKLAILKRKRHAIWQQFNLDAEKAEGCRVIVPGTVMPGCEISIGTAFCKTREELINSTFTLNGNEVAISCPAISVSHEILSQRPA